MHKLTLPLLAALLAAPAANSSLLIAGRPAITVVTVNMAKETSADIVLREWRENPGLRQADIFLLQEVKEQSGAPCIASRLGTALGLRIVYSPEAAGVTDRGLAILSRFPLRDIDTRPLKSFDLRFNSRKRFALSATADTPWGPVRLHDVHLDTRLNSADRLAQLDPVVHERDGFNGPRIVAGDFNSNPFYWVEHVLPLPLGRSQAVAVDSFMTKHGFRTAIPESDTTFDYLGMHLDWIWTAGLHSTGSKVIPLDFSDHHAVWTRVEFN